MKDALIDCFKLNYYGFYRMIGAYLPDSIEVKSAGEVRNIYTESIMDEEVSYEDKKYSIKHIVKKNLPLFCIMLKIT